MMGLRRLNHFGVSVMEDGIFRVVNRLLIFFASLRLCVRPFRLGLLWVRVVSRQGVTGVKLLRYLIVFCVIFGFASAFLSEAVAGKLYKWKDAEDKIHFSDRPPTTNNVKGDVEEKKIREAPVLKEETKEAKNPVEHAVQCTFRLMNKKGGGSGFFISSSGLAVTAKHVVQGSTYSMKAELRGEKKKYLVKIIRKSRKYDLALLQVVIDRSVPFLEFRSPDSLVPGEEVWAVGNPLLAFRETVTKGVFSRIFLEKDFKDELKLKRAPFKYKGDWIQFSSPVTGGNSGGPVVDEKGKLIGVVSWGVPAHSALNFGVPSSYILEDFKTYLP